MAIEYEECQIDEEIENPLKNEETEEEEIIKIKIEDSLENDIEKNNTNEETEEKKEENDSLKSENKFEKIKLPKEFKYLMDIVKEYNETFMKVQNKEFVQNALKKALEEELENVSKNIAKSFSDDLIQELEKKDYFKIGKIKNNFQLILENDIENLDIPVIYFDKKQFKKEMVLNSNSLYKKYKEIVKGEKEFEDLFEMLEMDYFVEDLFEL